MREVEMFFDYASPWAYLANELIGKKLAGVPLVLRPIYLRGLETFAEAVPYPASKMAYIARDLMRCAEHEGVPVAPPPVFPVNGLYALRAALLAEREGALDRVHRALFRATWAEQKNVSDKSVVAELVRALGLDAVATGLDEPWVKAELRSRTEQAVARGVFGVPTFAFGDELFWGHDRLEYVARFAGA